MLLDIIIPHHNEEWKVCAPIFNMLSSQKCVDFNDFRVTVVHNGKYARLYESDIAWIRIGAGPLNFRQYTLEESGVSKARNYGLDQADAEWVMFCDVDDCFTSIYSLASVFYILKSEAAKQFDLVWGPFYMSGANFTERVQCPEFSPVFIHNKYYRRSFLNEHHLRFPEDIYMSEDSAFNTVVRMEMGQHRIGSINTAEPLYAWCRRAGSITMDFSKWLQNTEGHFERNLYVMNEYKKRGRTDGMELLIGRVITDVYAMLTRTNTPQASNRFMKRVSDFYLEHEEEYKSIPKEKLQEALAASDRDLSMPEDNKKSRPPLDEWVETHLATKML